MCWVVFCSSTRSAGAPQAKSAVRSCLTSLLASRQGHDGEGAADVGEIVLVVAVQRTREPAAALALMRAEPVAAALQGWIAGRDAGAAQHEDHEAGAVAVADVGCLRLVIVTDVLAE